ncbi:MAG: benzoate-CoA ligase family protein [Betaproteobacteria bacterium]|nr:benzoate-CoA ligase family protein [Betaproteobacteria bacterium]
MELSRADQSVSPPRLTIPRTYNAAFDLLQRNLAAGRADKTAYLDDQGSCSYGQLAEKTGRWANALAALGVRREERVFMCMLDTIDFPVAFLGTIRAGAIAVPVNTLLTANDYAYMLKDSRATTLVVSSALWPTFAGIVTTIPTLKNIVIAGEEVAGKLAFAKLVAAASPEHETCDTTCDDAAFWLYSSGSTGAPKGTVHLQSSLIYTAELYGQPVLGITEHDLVFSAAKLFFAYGLGNGLSFPLAVGATVVLMAERPTPASVFKRLTEQRPTIFYGVPTLYAALLAAPDAPPREALNLRRCTSAGEPLPEDLGKRWVQKYGIDILDGIGSTEMLHIYLSNRVGEVRYGTTGKPVPGYEIRLVDDAGQPVAQGEIGELQVMGPSSAAMYWNNREKSRNTFQGWWTKSGDKYTLNAEGYYVYAGRSDDMLKVGGIYVSPAEVEAALITHPAVLEAAVVGKEDENRLIKPAAFVVLKAGQQGSEALANEIKRQVKDQLAPYKYPRWLEFVAELPKTATGKIQRFKLR